MAHQEIQRFGSLQFIEGCVVPSSVSAVQQTANASIKHLSESNFTEQIWCKYAHSSLVVKV